MSGNIYVAPIGTPTIPEWTDLRTLPPEGILSQTIADLAAGGGCSMDDVRRAVAAALRAEHDANRAAPERWAEDDLDA